MRNKINPFSDNPKIGYFDFGRFYFTELNIMYRYRCEYCEGTVQLCTIKGEAFKLGVLIMTFSDVVEAIKSLYTEERQEIQRLLEQYLREEHHEEILEELKSAQVEQQKGELKFSCNIKELRQLIEE